MLGIDHDIAHVRNFQWLEKTGTITSNDWKMESPVSDQPIEDT